MNKIRRRRMLSEATESSPPVEDESIDSVQEEEEEEEVIEPDKLIELPVVVVVNKSDPLPVYKKLSIVHRVIPISSPEPAPIDNALRLYERKTLLPFALKPPPPVTGPAAEAWVRRLSQMNAKETSLDLGAYLEGLKFDDHEAAVKYRRSGRFTLFLITTRLAS